MTIPNVSLGDGFRTVDATALAAALAADLKSYQSGIVAKAGGGQSGATLITEGQSVVVTVASGNDSVRLPPAVPGMNFFIVNAHASNSMQVFGTSPDTINGVATGTGVAQAAGKSALYCCAAPNAWFRLLSA